MVRHAAKLDVDQARELIKMPPAQACDLVEDAADALAERRALRQRRGTSGQLPRCKGCNVFMRSSTARCTACGFQPGIGWAA